MGLYGTFKDTCTSKSCNNYMTSHIVSQKFIKLFKIMYLYGNYVQV